MNRGNGPEIKFSPDDQKRLNDAIMQAEKCRELSEAWSKQTEDITRSMANYDDVDSFEPGCQPQHRPTAQIIRLDTS
jgi:hypothetical protein